MNEIEVKFLEIHPTDFRAKLESLDAQKIFEGIIHSEYYDFPDKRLEDEKIRFRIRDFGNECKMTCKARQKDKDFQVCIEDEITISDMAAARCILKTLGLQIIRDEKRTRTSYLLENARIEIDEYSHIPPFLEIEAESRDDVRRAAEQLGLSMKDAKAWSGGKVLRYYEKKENEKKENMKKEKKESEK